jgi:hypothetical protein
LVREGIESNPGPPRRSRDDEATPEALAQHTRVWQFAAEHLRHATVGDTFSLVTVDETACPPLTRTWSMTLKESLQDYVTRRFTAKALVVLQWRVHCVDVANGNQTEGVFPTAPGGFRDPITLTYRRISALTTSLPTPHAATWTDVPAAELFPGCYDAVEIPTYTRIPDGQDRQAFRALCRHSLEGFKEADLEGRATRIHRFLDIVKRHCRMLRGSASTKVRARHRARQLAGQVLHQTHVVAFDETRDDSADARAVAAARRHAGNGHLGRAARTLSRDDTTKLPNDYIAQLRKLHPDGPSPQISQPLPVFAIDFTVEAVRECVRACCSGAAPGPTGWTEELLLDALHDERTALDIAAAITDIANARVTTPLRDRLVRARLMPLAKPGSGVRPIAMGEVLVKVASRLAMQAAAPEINAFFAGTQYGVASPAGLDTIVHTARDYLRQHGRQATTMVTLDYANAFNVPSRIAMYNAASAIPTMRGIFYLEYAQPAELLLLDRKTGETTKLLSRCGSRQGSAAGPLFFCLTLQHALTESNRTPGVLVQAFMDDVTILAPSPELAETAIMALCRHTAPLGLLLNEKKCHVLSLSRPTENMRCFTVDSGASKLLGAAVGFTDAAEKTLLARETAGKHTSFFRRLQRMCDPCGAAILGVSGVPKITHVVRSHAPEVSIDVAAAFDSEVEAVWTGWSGAAPDADTRTLAHLPRKRGGLGFTRSVWVAPDAYTASANKGLHLAGVQQQSELTNERNRLLAEELSTRSAPHAHLLRVSAEPGSSAWLHHPTLRVKPTDFAAALRMRLLASLPGCPETISCPGCSSSFQRSVWIGHVVGCPTLSGHESRAGRHRQFKDALSELFHEAGVGHDPTEPREYLCDCGSVADEYAEHMAHRAACARVLPADKKKAGKSQGPDIRACNIMQDARLAACGALGQDGSAEVDAPNLLIDVTVVAACAPTHVGQKIEQMFGDATAAKCKKYATMSARRKEPLYVAAATHLGHLSRPLTELVRQACVKGRLDPVDALATVSAKVAFALAALAQVTTPAPPLARSQIKKRSCEHSKSIVTTTVLR